jgi:hypothetical protein
MCPIAAKRYKRGRHIQRTEIAYIDPELALSAIFILIFKTAAPLRAAAPFAASFGSSLRQRVIKRAHLHFHISASIGLSSFPEKL